MGHDQADTQLLEGSSELGALPLAPELFVDAVGLLGRSLEDTVPVAVEGRGDAVSIYDLPEHHHVALGVLTLSEQRGRDSPRGVVHGADQRHPGTSPLQPVVLAAVYLQQHPLLRVALPSAVAPGGLAAARTPHSCGQQDPPDGGARQVNPLVLRQHLRQVGVVEACVEAFGQFPHPLLGIGIRGRRRPPAPVPVSYRSCSLLSVRCQ